MVAMHISVMGFPTPNRSIGKVHVLSHLSSRAARDCQALAESDTLGNIAKHRFIAVRLLIWVSIPKHAYGHSQDSHFCSGPLVPMCYSQLKLWRQCGHFLVAKEYCEHAKTRSPATYCAAAHMPAYSEVEYEGGHCPDQTKHPPMDGVANGGRTTRCLHQR